MSREIHIYTPYYLTEDFERQRELDLCLQKNIDTKEIDKIFLLVDDNHRPSLNSEKLVIIDMEHRPSYADWLSLTKKYSADAISVLANSDIYFDGTVKFLADIFAASDRAFVAISRYEIVGNTTMPHKNPHWSQDVWAIDGRVPISADVHKKTVIPLGVPRCDNKIAYIFSVHGYDIFNPCNFIRTYHLHETQLRSYDAHVDKRILGGTAWVYPSESMSSPSKMIFDIWTLKPEHVERIKINDTIIVKEKQGLSTVKKKISSAIVCYDRNWQFPAITEQHAFERLSEDLQLRNEDGGVLYLAYPWATLIDNLLHNKKNPEKTDFLKKKLLSLKSKIRGAHTVITTCQHIHMLRFQSLFQEMGVTDIFWSHATKGQLALPQFPDIKIHPFPLYPVQTKDAANDLRKKHLYSFVGAKANQYYLTQSRNIIIEDLSKLNSGFIAGNETWHYNKVVYDYQVRGIVNSADALVDNTASDRYRQVLQESVFSLCPSGTGPNSIRLWESIGLGAIPVILSDNLALPGDAALWEEAVVFCKEDKASILSLPEKLQKIHADPKHLERKRHAMAQIWELYGIKSFVYDIRLLMLERSQQGRLKVEESIVKAPVTSSELPLNLSFLTTEILLAPENFTERFAKNRTGIDVLIANASASHKELFYRALQFRNLEESWSNT